MLDDLPQSLLQCLLLEWISPKSVFAVVRVSAACRRCVLQQSPRTLTYRAKDGEILPKYCVRWFGVHRVNLRLWTTTTVRMERHRKITETFANGKLHSENGRPAVVDKYPSGSTRRTLSEWWWHGKIHRGGDKAAFIASNGTKTTKIWFKYGKIHRRRDEPAVLWEDGTKEYVRHGKRHRRHDKPAVIWRDGSLEYYRRGKRHRGGGRPAIINVGKSFPENMMPKHEWFRFGKPSSRRAPLGSESNPICID